MPCSCLHCPTRPIVPASVPCHTAPPQNFPCARSHPQLRSHRLQPLRRRAHDCVRTASIGRPTAQQSKYSFAQGRMCWASHCKSTVQSVPENALPLRLCALEPYRLLIHFALLLARLVGCRRHAAYRLHPHRARLTGTLQLLIGCRSPHHPRLEQQFTRPVTSQKAQRRT